MNLTELPDMTFEQFITSVTPRHEYLGLVRIKKSEIYGHSELPMCFPAVCNFFQTGIFMDPDIAAVTGIWPLDYTCPNTLRWMVDVEKYCKYVWLTDEFLNHSFKNPMGAIWNPIHSKFDIHPGSTRRVVHYFFGPDEAVFLTYNTGGKEVNWIRKFTSKEQLNKEYGDDVSCVFCSDHRTIIPHIHLGTKDIYPNVMKTFAKITEFFATTKIEANFPLNEVGYSDKLVTNHKRTMRVVVDDPASQLDAVKAFMLIPNFRSFDKFGVKIEITESAGEYNE